MKFNSAYKISMCPVYYSNGFSAKKNATRQIIKIIITFIQGS